MLMGVGVHALGLANRLNILRRFRDAKHGGVRQQLFRRRAELVCEPPQVVGRRIRVLAHESCAFLFADAAAEYPNQVPRCS